MDQVKVQAIVDESISIVRKDLIRDIHAAVPTAACLKEATDSELKLILESIADAALKASADLLVETLKRIL